MLISFNILRKQTSAGTPIVQKLVTIVLYLMGATSSPKVGDSSFMFTVCEFFITKTDPQKTGRD